MNTYYLLIDGQQAGPYTEEQIQGLFAAGQITEDTLAWREGLAEWQQVGALIDLPTVPPPAPPIPPEAHVSQTASTHRVIQTNVKQGALLGGVVCLLVGLGLMYFSLFSFFLYGPLFLAAFILSIVALAQGRILGGVILLLVSLIVPAVSGLVLSANRAAHFLSNVTGVDSDLALTKCKSSAKMVFLGCQQYAIDHNGAYPTQVSEISPTYLTYPSQCKDPLTHNDDFLLMGGHDSDSPSKPVVVSAGKTSSGKRVIIDTKGNLTLDFLDNPTVASSDNAPTLAEASATPDAASSGASDSSAPSAPAPTAVANAATPPPQTQHLGLDQKLGFRTYKLGTPFSQFNPDDLDTGESFEKTDTKPYFVKTFDKQLGAAEIDAIELDFNQDLLQRVRVSVKGKQSSLALKEALVAAYGNADKDSDFMTETLTWEGEDCVLILAYDIEGNASANFTSKTVDAKIDAITEQKAKAGAAAGANGL